jgi:hypothetical protein
MPVVCAQLLIVWATRGATVAHFLQTRNEMENIIAWKMFTPATKSLKAIFTQACYPVYPPM